MKKKNVLNEMVWYFFSENVYLNRLSIKKIQNNVIIEIIWFF